MTAGAAFGVYRAYRYVLHERVTRYLGLYRDDDEHLALTDENQPIEVASEMPIPAGGAEDGDRDWYHGVGDAERISPR